MKINVKKLDDTISKLQELRRLATDPALAPFVSITGRASPNGSITHNETESTANGNGHGALKASVLAACKDLSGNFTIKDIYKKMLGQGYVPTSESSEKVVGNILRGMANKREIIITILGKGRRPTQYANRG